MKLRYQLGALLCATVAVLALLMGAGTASAVTFSQSGNVVQVNTINSTAAWSFDVFWTDTTETPVPTTHKLNTYNVSAGQSAYSMTLPDDHRRYRFDVSSVVPSRTVASTQETGTLTTSNGALAWFDSSGSAYFQVVRGGTVLWQSARNSGGSIATLVVHAGDVCRWYAYDSVAEDYGTILQVSRDGTLTISGSGTFGWYWSDDDNQHYLQWNGTQQFVAKAGGGVISPVDDGGSGTFENPSWVGFSVPNALGWADVTVGKSPLTVTFSAAGSTGLGLSYLWQFGDGWTSTDCTATHTYSGWGVYPVTLQVSNSFGLVDDYALSITVEPSTSPEPTGSIEPTMAGSGGPAELYSALGLTALDARVFVALLVILGGVAIGYRVG